MKTEMRLFILLPVLLSACAVGPDYVRPDTSLSIVMTVPGGPSLLGLPFFGLLGFLGAVFGGVWLLLSIWKSSRADRE